MNRIKQWDAKLDAWAEKRLPGIIYKLLLFECRLLGVAIGVGLVYLIILWATKGQP